MVLRPLQYSPKQVSAALGVSESSVKRWCDRGVIPTVRTVGGHRKITMEGLQEFLRQTGRAIQDPELIGLNTSARQAIPGGEEPQRVAFREAVASGDESRCRRILLDLVEDGYSRSQAAEYLVTDALHGLGEAWDCQQLDVYQERHACTICCRLIDELRAGLPEVDPNAPVAIGGTPEGDLYQLPTAIVELALREVGWRAMNIGSNLPLNSLLTAAQHHQAQLVWLSVSHVVAPAMFVAEQNRLAAALGDDVALLIGGRGLTDKLRPQLRYTAHCDSVRSATDLAAMVLAAIKDSGNQRKAYSSVSQTVPKK